MEKKLNYIFFYMIYYILVTIIVFTGCTTSKEIIIKNKLTEKQFIERSYTLRKNGSHAYDVTKIDNELKINNEKYKDILESI